MGNYCCTNPPNKQLPYYKICVLHDNNCLIQHNGFNTHEMPNNTSSPLQKNYLGSFETMIGSSKTELHIWGRQLFKNG